MDVLLLMPCLFVCMRVSVNAMFVCVHACQCVPVCQRGMFVSVYGAVSLLCLPYCFYVSL